MWNNLKSLTNQIVHGHKGRHFSQVEIAVGDKLLELSDENSAGYKTARDLVHYLTNREVEILKGVALGQRSRKSVKEIMRSNRL